MESTEAPEPLATLKDLSPVTRLIYEAIDSGVQEAKGYFDKKEKDVEPHLAASLVRYHAALHIDEKAPEVAGLTREPLPNSGLHVQYGVYGIRILKSDEGEIPSPGVSKARQSYYQQTITGWAELVGEEESGYVNLIIVWDVNHNYLMMGLTLACPKDGSAAYRSAELHWKLPVPHPADTPRSAPAPHPGEAVIGTLADDVDLPLTKNLPDKTGTDGTNG